MGRVPGSRGRVKAKSLNTRYLNLNDEITSLLAIPTAHRLRWGVVWFITAQRSLAADR
jgi:hypothetical protein